MVPKDKPQRRQRRADGELSRNRILDAATEIAAERGYEVFCAAKDAVFLWDKILEVGKPFGAMPVSWDCLDIVRVEGSLLFFPFDMPHKDTTPFEVLMDWSVDLSKPDFRGKAALLARKGTERTHQAGLEVLAAKAITPGAKIFKDGAEVGVVNSTTYSRHLMKSLALVSLRPDVTALGPVPSADRAALEQYIVRLQQVGQAMDFVARAYSEALRGSQMLANELITLRSEVDQQRLADPQLTALFGVADDLARRSPQPTEALASLMETCRRYVAWLAGLAGARGTVDR